LRSAAVDAQIQDIPVDLVLTRPRERFHGWRVARVKRRPDEIDLAPRRDWHAG
jgi:hypothetical protein